MNAQLDYEIREGVRFLRETERQGSSQRLRTEAKMLRWHLDSLFRVRRALREERRDKWTEDWERYYGRHHSQVQNPETSPRLLR